MHHSRRNRTHRRDRILLSKNAGLLESRYDVIPPNAALSEWGHCNFKKRISRTFQGKHELLRHCDQRLLSFVRLEAHPDQTSRRSQETAGSCLRPPLCHKFSETLVRPEAETQRAIRRASAQQFSLVEVVVEKGVNQKALRRSSSSSSLTWRSITREFWLRVDVELWGLWG